MTKKFLKVSKYEFVQNVKNVFYDGKMYLGIWNTCTRRNQINFGAFTIFCKKFLPDCKQTADVEDDVPRKNSEHYEEIWTATNAVGCSVFFLLFFDFLFFQLFFFCIIYFQKCILYLYIAKTFLYSNKIVSFL